MTRRRSLTIATSLSLGLTLAIGAGWSFNSNQANAETEDSAKDKNKVEITKIAPDEMVKNIADHGKAKYTLVDAWATWCTPCMENFPHVVEMHKKYADKGLRVCSLSMDDTKDQPKVLKFLKEKKATFTNFMTKDPEAAFENLKIEAIPAVFLFDPQGKIVKRFTMDDPDNQFTYEDVEKTLEKLFDSKKPAKP